MSTMTLISPTPTSPSGLRTVPELLYIDPRLAKELAKIPPHYRAKLVRALSNPVPASRWKKMTGASVWRVRVDEDFRICCWEQCVIHIGNHHESDQFVRSFRPQQGSFEKIPIKEFLMSHASKQPIPNLTKTSAARPAAPAAPALAAAPVAPIDSEPVHPVVRELRGLMRHVAKEDVDAMRDLIREEYDQELRTQSERLHSLEQRALTHACQTEALRGELKQLHETWERASEERFRRLGANLADCGKRLGLTEGRFADLSGQLDRSETSHQESWQEVNSRLAQTLAQVAQHQAQQEQNWTVLRDQLADDCVRPVEIQGQRLQELERINANLITELTALGAQVGQLERQITQRQSFRWVTEGWQKLRGWWHSFRPRQVADGRGA